MTPEELNAELGNIDLFLLDQILKGRFNPEMKILDAGCGEGRNLLYFLKNSFDVYALDKNRSAIQMVRMHARTLGSNVDLDNFIVGDINHNPFPDNHFDAINCLSVLHFVEGTKTFEKSIIEIKRILKPGGFFVLKMDTITGIEEKINSLGDGLYRMADSSVRFLLTDDHIFWLTQSLKFEIIEPVRYEVSQNKSSVSIVMKHI